MTHTYVVLEVSKKAYDEIQKKLLDAGYAEQMSETYDYGLVIDMHGIALAVERT